MTRTVRRRNCCGFWVDRLTMPDCMPSSLDKPILQKSVFATKCRETSFQHLGSATLPFESPFSDGHEFDHRPCLLKGSTTSKWSTNLDPFKTHRPTCWELPPAARCIDALSKQVSTGTSRPNETTASRPISCSWSQRFLIFIIEWDVRIAKPSWW